MKTPALFSGFTSPSGLAAPLLAAFNAASLRTVGRAALPAVLWAGVLAALGLLLASTGTGSSMAAHGGQDVCLLEQILDVIAPSLQFDSLWS